MEIEEFEEAQRALHTLKPEWIEQARQCDWRTTELAEWQTKQLLGHFKSALSSVKSLPDPRRKLPKSGAAHHHKTVVSGAAELQERIELTTQHFREIGWGDPIEYTSLGKASREVEALQLTRDSTEAAKEAATAAQKSASAAQAHRIAAYVTTAVALVALCLSWFQACRSTAANEPAPPAETPVDASVPSGGN